MRSWQQRARTVTAACASRTRVPSRPSLPYLGSFPPKGSTFRASGMSNAGGGVGAPERGGGADCAKAATVIMRFKARSGVMRFMVGAVGGEGRDEVE